MSILTGRKKTQFLYLCSSVILNPIGTKFATDVPASWGGLHAKFGENHSSHFRDTSEQFRFNFFVFSSSFRMLHKIHHKTQMRVRIGLKFDTLTGLIKADLSTKFGRNPMNIHGSYDQLFGSKVCHAYRVNPLEE